jgi:WD40 repeat protein
MGLKDWSGVATLEMTGGQVRAIAFSPDKRWIAAGMGRTGSKGFIHLLDARNWKVVRTLEGHSGSLISKLAFSRDAKKLVSGSTDVKVWDVDTGRALHSFKGGISKIVPVDVSPGGQVLAHGSQDSGNPEPTSITIRDLKVARFADTERAYRIR